MERVFLKRFIELCSSQMLCVRKSCAANLANFAVYISKDSFKKNLVSFQVKNYNFMLILFYFYVVSMFFKIV